MSDRDEHVRRLKDDGATTAAGSLCALALLAPVVAAIDLLAPGTQGEMRASPAYWLLMLIPGVWGYKLLDYSPLALRTIRPLLMVLPLATAAIVLWAHARGEPMGSYRALLALVIVAVAIGGLCYRRSLLAREGAGS